MGQLLNMQQKIKELEAANRTLKNDKEVMADDKNSLSQRLDQIKRQTMRLKQALSYEHESYASVGAAHRVLRPPMISVWHSFLAHPKKTQRIMEWCRLRS